MAPQYRLRSELNEWRWDATIQPGQEQTFEMQGFRGNLANSVLGWVLFPTKVIYQNDSSWSPQQPEQCFQIFWRDRDHPSLEVLPPLFVDMDED